MVETHDIGRRLDGYTSTQAAVRRQKAANSKHHAIERKEKKIPPNPVAGEYLKSDKPATHITHDDTTRLVPKRNKGKPISK